MGVEKIAITFVDPSVAAPTHKLSASDVALECDDCSATDTMQAWQETLTNTEQILDMTVDRMSRNWLSLAPKMRKAFTLKDVDPC